MVRECDRHYRELSVVDDLQSDLEIYEDPSTFYEVF
jgi:hypothetical protein